MAATTHTECEVCDERTTVEEPTELGWTYEPDEGGPHAGKMWLCPDCHERLSSRRQRGRYGCERAATTTQMTGVQREAATECLAACRTVIEKAEAEERARAYRNASPSRSSAATLRNCERATTKAMYGAEDALSRLQRLGLGSYRSVEGPSASDWLADFRAAERRLASELTT